MATYDLGRLRTNGIIEREPGTNHYHVTPRGRRMAMLFTRVGARVIVSALTQLVDISRPPRGSPAPLIAASRSYDKELDRFIKRQRAV